MITNPSRERGYPKVTTGPNPTGEDVWIQRGAATRQAARSAFILASDPTLDGLLRSSLSIEEMGDDGVNKHWKGTIKYGVRQQPANGFVQVSMSSKGGRGHISHSLETVNSYALDGREAGDYRNSIGVSERGVAGVDVVAPKMTLTMQLYIEEDLLDANYRNTLFFMTGTVNQDAFYGLAPGEVLFLGFDAERHGVDPDTEQILVRLVYDFAIEPNLYAADGNAIQISTLPPIDKAGHDYLWIRSEDLADTQAKLKVKIPFEAHVERVYRRTQFSKLGLNGLL